MKLLYDKGSVPYPDIECRHKMAFIAYIAHDNQLRIRSVVIHPLQKSLKPIEFFYVSYRINMLKILTSVVCA